MIYAHTRPDQAMVDVENTRTVITPEHLRDWCQQAGTRVTVRPVIDLNAELSTDVHDPTETMKEQARLRHRPACSPTAGDPHGAATSTTSSNGPPVAPPPSTSGRCVVRHHRLKTHTDWTYTPLGRDGHRITFEWTDPSGRRHIS